MTSRSRKRNAARELELRRMLRQEVATGRAEAARNRVVLTPESSMPPGLSLQEEIQWYLDKGYIKEPPQPPKSSSGIIAAAVAATGVAVAGSTAAFVLTRPNDDSGARTDAPGTSITQQRETTTNPVALDNIERVTQIEPNNALIKSGDQAFSERISSDNAEAHVKLAGKTTTVYSDNNQEAWTRADIGHAPGVLDSGAATITVLDIGANFSNGTKTGNSAPRYTIAFGAEEDDVVFDLHAPSADQPANKDGIAISRLRKHRYLDGDQKKIQWNDQYRDWFWHPNQDSILGDMRDEGYVMPSKNMKVVVVQHKVGGKIVTEIGFVNGKKVDEALKSPDPRQALLDMESSFADPSAPMLFRISGGLGEISKLYLGVRGEKGAALQLRDVHQSWTQDGNFANIYHADSRNGRGDDHDQLVMQRLQTSALAFGAAQQIATQDKDLRALESSTVPLK